MNLCDFLVNNMCMFLDCSSWFMKEILASLAARCRVHYNPTSGGEPLKWLDTEQNSGESDECSGEDFGTVYRVGNISTCPILVELEVEGQPFVMEVDTGAAVSLISE